MPSFKQTVAINVGLIILFGVVGYFNLQSKKIETEQLRIHEQQATERTEERSHFWQKLIPYGNNEDEQQK